MAFPRGKVVDIADAEWERQVGATFRTGDMIRTVSYGYIDTLHPVD